MNRTDTAAVLAYISRATGQPVPADAVKVWHDLIGDLPLERAQEATRRALSDPSLAGRRLVPADVLTFADQIRRQESEARQLGAGHVERTYIRARDVPEMAALLSSIGEGGWAAKDVPCPFCDARAGEPCTVGNVRRNTPHPSRLEAAKKEVTTA